MKYKNTLLAVADMERSKSFYRELLGLRVVADFGANVTLSGGLALQTLESWRDFIGKEEICFFNNAAEVYFEEDDFDAFAERLAAFGVNYVHPVLEHRWGQRAVRFYDPDGHIVEVGENMAAVCGRFAAQGLSVRQIALRMDVPEGYVKRMIKK